MNKVINFFLAVFATGVRPCLPQTFKLVVIGIRFGLKALPVIIRTYPPLALYAFAQLRLGLERVVEMRPFMGFDTLANRYALVAGLRCNMDAWFFVIAYRETEWSSQDLVDRVKNPVFSGDSPPCRPS
jgi:hypothetical protein